MFERPDRYDLSDVGRYKMNQRLNFDQKNKHRLLQAEDLVAIVREIVKLNNQPDAKEDDIDHLGNRRLKAVGELLQGRLRIGLSHMRRIVNHPHVHREQGHAHAGPACKLPPISAVVKEFFASSQLSQFMDQINPLAELEQSAYLGFGPGGLTPTGVAQRRDVRPSHYGRMCPIQTPEGANIGLINYLASYTRVNEYGFLEAPYAVVKDSVITKEIVWLDASEEERHKITHAGVNRDESGRITDAVVEARIHGDPATCSAKDVDLIHVAPHEFISIATALFARTATATAAPTELAPSRPYEHLPKPETTRP